MKKAMGYLLAGWPFAVVGVLGLVLMYRDVGLKWTVLVLGSMFVTGGSVMLGLKLIFPKE